MIAELSTFLGVITLIALSPALRPIHAWWTSPYRVWIRACWRADCRYKLRAASSRRQRTARRGSAAPDGEPQPAPTVPTDPGAGPNLQSGLSRLEQGRRRDHSSEQPQPAPPSSHPGAGIPAGSTPHQVLPAGPKPRVTAAATRMSADDDPDRDADTPGRTTVSASPIKRPAIVADTPESTAVAGLPAHDWSTAVAGLPTPGWGSGPSAATTDGPVRSV
jgi:hypothetical protein